MLSDSSAREPGLTGDRFTHHALAMITGINSLKKAAKLRKRILYLIAVLFAVFFLINTALALYLYWNEGQVLNRLLTEVNKRQQGQLTVGGIQLSPFRYFPQIALELRDVVYHQSAKEAESPASVPICRFRRFYLVFDLPALLRGNIHVSQAAAEEGQINLILYRDNTLNLLKALASTDSLPETKTDTISTAGEPSESADYHIHSFELRDTRVDYTNHDAGRKAAYQFHLLKTSLDYDADSLSCNLDSEFDIIGIGAGQHTFLQNQSSRLQLNLLVDFVEQQIHLRPSSFQMGQVVFRVSGHYDLTAPNDFHLQFSGSDQDMSFYKLFLHEEVIKQNLANLDKGDIYFEGDIAGKATDDFYTANISFGVRDLNLEAPEGATAIDSLNFTGRFSTGDKQDYSSAYLRLNNLRAKLPDGYIYGDYQVNNLMHPRFQFQSRARINLDKLNQIFRLDAWLTEPRGVIRIDSDYRGIYDKKTRRMVNRVEKSVITLDSVSFALAGSGYQFDLLDGRIHRFADHYYLDSLTYRRNLSDLTISGEISRLIDLLYEEDVPMNGKVTIRCNRLRIKDLIGQDASRSAILCDTLTDLHLDARLSSSSRSFKNFYMFPAGAIQIDHLSASLKTTPDIVEAKGLLTFANNPLQLTIGFDELKLRTSAFEGKVQGDLVLADSLQQPLNLVLDLQKTSLPNLRRELTLIDLDYAILDSLPGRLDTRNRVRFIFAPGHSRLEQVLLSDGDFDYYPVSDPSVRIFRGVKFEMVSILYDSASGIVNGYDVLLSTGEIKTPNLNTQDLSVAIERRDKQYLFYPDIEHLLGGREVRDEGYILYDMSDSIPVFDINYQVEKYRIEQVLDAMSRQRLLSGKLDLSLVGHSRGSGLSELLNNLDGTVTASGEDLTLYGIDLDRVLAKVQRLQSFNLVDLSAYFVAGPLAPLATKGYDFANVLTSSLGEHTKVNKLISSWKVNNGEAEIIDAALTTNKNRLAVKGRINISRQEFQNIAVAVLNKKGCAVIKQTINGPFADPELSDLEAAGPIRGTLQNLIRAITGSDCKPFYTGALPHPAP